MKVGIVTEYFFPFFGGITENVYNTAGQLRKKGVAVKIITAEPAWNSDGHASPEFGANEIIRIGTSVPIYSNGSIAHFAVGLGLRRRLRAVLEKEQFDILHVHSPLVVTLPMLALLEAKCPCVGTFHTYFESSAAYALFKGVLRARVLPKLAGQVAVSQSCVQALRRYFDIDPIIIPNGVDTDIFNPGVPPLEKFDSGKRNLLFLGRFDPRNGLAFMIRVFEKVKRRFPEVRLIVVGSGPLRRGYAGLVPRELRDDVFFEGVTWRLRPQYYSSCSVFCSPVSKASFGVTLLEAMASGKSIVATDNVGYRELLGDGEGFLVPPGDTDAFADRVIELLTDESLRTSMEANGRRKALAFSWDTLSDKLLEYYRRILGTSW